MNRLTPLKRCQDLFNDAEKIGAGLCALGSVLALVDQDQLVEKDEDAMNGLGLLVSALGSALLYITTEGQKESGNAAT